MITGIAAFNESRIDDTWYTDVTTFARDTPWLNTPMLDYSNAGMVLFAILILTAWWIGRHSTPSVMAAAIGVPIAAVTAYLANDGIKWIVSEQRPCHTLPAAFLLEPCPAIEDYSFPSNHAAVAAAMAAAFFLVDRRLGLVATVAALFMGFSRVYVGAHYPHDVIVGLLVGAVVGTLAAILVRGYGTPLVERFSDGRLRPLLTSQQPRPYFVELGEDPWYFHNRPSLRAASSALLPQLTLRDIRECNSTLVRLRRGSTTPTNSYAAASWPALLLASARSTAARRARR